MSAAHRIATSPHLDNPLLGQPTVSEKVDSYVYALYPVRVAIAMSVFSYFICHDFHAQ